MTFEIRKKISETLKRKGIKPPLGKRFEKGHIPWSKGKKLKNRRFLNHKWKGNNANLRSKHQEIMRELGNPTKCEHCKKDGLTGHKIHWANKDHKYKRVLEDYIRLCAKCHGVYDKVNNLRKHHAKFKRKNNAVNRTA